VAVNDMFHFVGAPGHEGVGTVFVYDSDNASDAISEIVPFQGSPGDEFGSAIDVSGNTLLVGAPVNEIDGILGGRAFVYRYASDQELWIQEDDLEAVAPSDLDYFGSSVALAQDLAVVGAPGDDEMGSNAGAVLVFRRDGVDWSFVTKLLAPESAGGERFGESIATDGDYVLVGSPYGLSEESRTGLAYLFSSDSSSFKLQKRFFPESTAAEQGFGSSVALEEGFAFVGAPGPGNSEAPGGTVSIFDMETDDSAASQVLVSGSTAAEQGFGASFDSHSGLVVVGSHRQIGDHLGPGSAGVYSRNGQSWDLLSPLPGSKDSKADGFGMSVSISSGLAAVGAAGDGTSGPNAGAVYFFSGDSEGWK
jgi:hypothetical protein